LYFSLSRSLNTFWLMACKKGITLCIAAMIGLVDVPAR